MGYLVDSHSGFDKKRERGGEKDKLRDGVDIK